MDRAPIDVVALARMANELFRDEHVDNIALPSAAGGPASIPGVASGLAGSPGVGLSDSEADFGGLPQALIGRPALGRPVLTDVSQAGKTFGSDAARVTEFQDVSLGPTLDPQVLPGFAPIPNMDTDLGVSSILSGMDGARDPMRTKGSEGARPPLSDVAARSAAVEALARTSTAASPRPTGGRMLSQEDLDEALRFGRESVSTANTFSARHLGNSQRAPFDEFISVPPLAGFSQPPRPRSIERPTPAHFAFTDTPQLGDFDEEAILRAALHPQTEASPVAEAPGHRAIPSVPPIDEFAPSYTPSFYFLEDRKTYFADDVPALLPQTAVPFSAELVRRDFPVLQQRVNGYPLVWLDNGATTQKPQAVIDRISTFYENDYSNISRSAHDLAARATNAYEDARKSVQRFINASEFDEIVFVRGTTEGINLVAQSFGRRFIEEGDEIVVTQGEHHANIVPWYNLAKEVGARLRVVPFDDNGEILLDAYEELLNRRVKIVATTHVANALGTILPVKTMTAMAHRHGIPILIDGAQSISHMPIDVQDIDCDFYVFSGHKLYAPTGIGALYGKKALLDQMPPWQGGGNMIKDVTFEKITFQPPPFRFEAGTGNIADAVGLAEAIKYLERLGMTNIAQYEHALLDYATHKLASIKGLTIIGNAKEKAGVISFLLKGKEPAEVGKMLNEKGIAVRAGHHCALPILRRYGVEATVRPAFAMYNTYDDADRLAEVVREIAAA